MISTSEDDLICDLAETYQIYDYKQLPLMMVAVFSYGLKDNSRIKMKMKQEKMTVETLILASILDNLNVLLWSKTKDGQKGVNRPKSVISAISDSEIIEDDKKELSFDSGKDFEKARKELLNRLD